MIKDETTQNQEEPRKPGWESSKLRKLKIFTYVQNKLEALMKKDALLVDTFNGKRFDLKNPTQEDYDFAMATCLVHSGKLTNDEIAIILRSFFTHGMGNSAPDDYFEKIINKAHESVKGPREQTLTTGDYKNLKSITNLKDVFINEVKNRRENCKTSQKTIYGLDTGFALFNEYTGGIMEKRLISISGKTGSGKTAFCLQLADQVIRKDKVNCLFVNYDQSFFDLNLMIFSRLSGVPHTTIANGLLQDKHMDKLYKVLKSDIENIETYLFILEADSSLSLNTLQTICEDIKPKLLIIDPINRIPLGRTQYTDTYSRNSEILSVLKQMSIELNSGIIVTGSLEGDLKTNDFSCSDIIIQIDQHKNIDHQDSFEITLNIEKNRFGKSNISLAYEFEPLYFEFREKEARQNK